MFRTRLVSSIFGILLVAGCIFAGGYLLKGLFLLLGFIGLYEFFKMMRAKDLQAFIIPSYLLFFCIACMPLLGTYFLPAVLLVVILFIISLVMFFREERFLEMVLSIFAAVYLGSGFYFALQISSYPDYFSYIVLAFVLTWASDIGGYAVGMNWGKHKMTPVLSPSKSWEGAAGCIMFTVVASLVFAYVTGAPYLVLWLALGIVASVTAQLGDLLESAFKRYFGVKDSGHLIPGHGGVLDRFDSFIFVLPLVYLIYTITHGVRLW